MDIRLLVVPLATFALLACQHEPPPSAPTLGGSLLAPGSNSPNNPAPTSPVSSSPAPELPRSGAACQVILSVDVQGSERLRTLRVYGRNITDKPLSFELPERCPKGLMDFEGLGPGYDYYGTCNAGACAGWPTTRHLTLAPNQPQPLAEAHIYLDGRPPCTAALAPGSYKVNVVVPSTSVVICTPQTILEVPSRTTANSRATASDDPYWCNASSDCVLSCPAAAGCCGHPCGCRHAINIRHRAAYEANYAKTCSHPPCPAVGCAYQPAVLAVCSNHRCVGTTTPAADGNALSIR